MPEEVRMSQPFPAAKQRTMIVTGTRRFWIGVASRDHVNVGVNGGFIQLNHGKRSAVRRLKAGDGVIMYSPRTTYPDGEPLQAFTAIGRVLTGNIYQVEVTPDFKPHRIDVQFVRSKETPIKPLIERLSFIKLKSHWGAAFRFGHVEVLGCDFALIAERMGAAIALHSGDMGTFVAFC
jgi:EVE domain